MPDGCTVRPVVQHRVLAKYPSLSVEWGLVVLDVPGLQHAETSELLFQCSG